MLHKLRPALAVFVKTPGLSPIKTRLASTWGETKALAFYEQCLQSTSKLMEGLKRDGWDISWAVAETEGLTDAHWRKFPGFPQGEGGLGARMVRVLNQLLDRRSMAIILGSDSPQVSYSHLEQAQQLLSKQADIVFGPALDGGFWLLGTRVSLPEMVWENVVYSQASSLADSLHALRQWDQNLCIDESLPVLRDVDTAADAEALFTTYE